MFLLRRTRSQRSARTDTKAVTTSFRFMERPVLRNMTIPFDQCIRRIMNGEIVVPSATFAAPAAATTIPRVTCVRIAEAQGSTIEGVLSAEYVERPSEAAPRGRSHMVSAYSAPVIISQQNFEQQRNALVQAEVSTYAQEQMQQM